MTRQTALRDGDLTISAAATKDAAPEVVAAKGGAAKESAKTDAAATDGARKDGSKPGGSKDAEAAPAPAVAFVSSPKADAPTAPYLLPFSSRRVDPQDQDTAEPGAAPRLGAAVPERTSPPAPTGPVRPTGPVASRDVAVPVSVVAPVLTVPDTPTEAAHRLDAGADGPEKGAQTPAAKRKADMPTPLAAKLKASSRVQAAAQAMLARRAQTRVEIVPQPKKLAARRPHAQPDAGLGGRSAVTVFGAPRIDTLSDRKRQILLAAIVIVSLFILAVVLWSSALDTRNAEAPGTESSPASPAIAPAIAPELATPPVIEAANTAPPPETAAVAQTMAADPVVPDPVPAPAPVPDSAEANAQTSAPETAPLSAGDAEARYSSSGVWTVAPDLADAPPSDARLSMRPVLPDPGPGNRQVEPIVSAAAADPSLPLVPPPPPFGTVLERGPDGAILPTPEGVITADGYTLFSGQPPVVPAQRPATVIAAAAQSVAQDAPVGPDETADAVANAIADAVAEAVADPLPDTRPRPRPPGIAPEDDAALATVADPAIAAVATDAEPGPDAGLAEDFPEPDPALAGRKPLARPASVVAAAASALAAPEPDPATTEPDIATGTRFAVASSRRPAARPRDFDRAVEAAVAAAVRSAADPALAPAPQPDPPQQETAAAPTEEIDEPEPVAAAPNIPTRASVAKQATIANAIPLNKVVLMGVFGSSSNRRALVRMGRDRYIKVTVGDRLDGGKVTAISSDKLSYEKGGRTHVLQLP